MIFSKRITLFRLGGVLTLLSMTSVFLVNQQYEVLSGRADVGMSAADVTAATNPSTTKTTTRPRTRRRRTRFTFGNYSTISLNESELNGARDVRRYLNRVYDEVVAGVDAGAATAPRSQLEEYFYNVASNPFNVEPVAAASKVVNPHPFKLIYNPLPCSSDENLEEEDYEPVFLLVYVHSGVTHFDRRELIRRTWGNVSCFEIAVRLVFVIGMPNTDDAVDVQRLVAAEWRRHGDLVQEDFVDSYLNMTYKAVAALKWISNSCRHARFVLKADDDIFVNMFSLLEILSKSVPLSNTRRPRLLICNHRWKVFEGAVDHDGKWSTERSVWRYEFWPPHCQGMAFVVTTDLAIDLYEESYGVPFLWMDDLYLTGFVMLRLRNVNTVALNRRYVQGNRLHDIRKDLDKSATTDAWRSYLFADVGGDIKEMHSFWEKVLSFEQGSPLLRRETTTTSAQPRETIVSSTILPTLNTSTSMSTKSEQINIPVHYAKFAIFFCWLLILVKLLGL